MSSLHAKPEFSESQVTEIMKRLFGLTLSKIQSLPSYDDQNFHVVTTDDIEYVLKIMNSEDSKNFGLIDAQTHAMAFLHQNGLPTQTAVPTTSGQLLSLEEIGRNRLCCRAIMSCSSCWVFNWIQCFEGKMCARWVYNKAKKSSMCCVVEELRPHIVVKAHW